MLCEDRESFASSYFELLCLQLLHDGRGEENVILDPW